MRVGDGAEFPASRRQRLCVQTELDPHRCRLSKKEQSGRVYQRSHRNQRLPESPSVDYWWSSWSEEFPRQGGRYWRCERRGFRGWVVVDLVIHEEMEGNIGGGKAI
ncbi:hypothetical protein SDJN03_26455, partial [Cucurbita argyrosperma subsp. sororia]